MPPCALAYEVRGAPGLRLYQETGDLHATGLKVWPSARLLAEHVIGAHGQGVQGLRVLELGAGTGAVGLACGIAGASRVVLSDRLVMSRLESGFGPGRRQLDMLEKNVSLNSPLLHNSPGTTVVELEFSAQAGKGCAVSTVLRRDGPFDLVLGSDIAYNPAAHPELARCILQVFDSHARMREGCAEGYDREEVARQTTVVLAQQGRQRGDIERLVDTFKDFGLSSQIVDVMGAVSILRVFPASATQA